ncbi:SDR family NAD(P)-dependent oxidoreductase [Patulibacter defluvii]|uniref:SDR family NAD(P)-dependent oxidoreductase n=1 Tax=Patulibacter defluvii TaxID=3095358 RepID=UPI002A75C518|nr:SDR family oxidoreductase [Patulibacter sp. DM4]
MKIAVVVGASSGIGRATAVRLAAGGSGVVLTYNANPTGAEQAVAEIEREGGSAVALPLDLADAAAFPAFADRLADELRERWRRTTFDHLVNNGGLARAAPFTETDEELLDDLYRVLLKGPFLLTRRLLPLLADGGAVVSTSSNAALPVAVSPGYAAYASMKGGLNVLTRYLAKELGPRGIRVNAVAPGPTRTRLGGDAFERHPELIPPLAAETTLGRLGEPEDVAGAIAALLGDECGWVTGELLEVSGGFRL